MSYSIKDIDGWKLEVRSYSFLEKFYYPLLKDIWRTYDSFDEDVENDSKKNNYITLCRYFIKPWKSEKENHEKFCMKLVRNLGHYSDNPESYSFTSEKCNNLNHWVYNSMKKHDIPEKTIIDIFGDYSYMLKRPSTILGCSYHSYDESYDDPMIAIILNIFDSNIHTIKNKLESNTDSVRCSCQKYVSKIVEIYKYMKTTYCSNGIVMRNPKTCEQLDSFARSYQFLYIDESVRDKIPSLEYEKPVNLHGCESDESLRGRPSTDTYPKEKPVETPQAPQFNENNDSSNSMSPTVSTALGTVAGASSLLALLYKFSPGRNWIRSGFRGGTGRISSNLYGEEPNELLYDGFAAEDKSSYNTGYNVGYGSA